MPGGRVHHSLGFAGGAGSVEYEQGIFRIHGLGLADIAHVVAAHLRAPPAVAAVDPADLGAGAAIDDDGVDDAQSVERFVYVGLERHLAAAAHPLVGGDHHPRSAIL